MGTLTIPSGGAIYLDANCMIYSVEKIAPYHALLEPIWLACQSETLEVVSSELVLVETLVKPVREGDEVLEKLFRELLLDSADVRLLPITRAILEAAVQIRAALGLQTADAIHAATALQAGCVQFITNDPVFKKVSGLPLVLLGDVAAL